MIPRHLVLASVFQVAAIPTPAPASAAEWVVEPARSSITFSGVQVGTPFSGRFERFRAEVDFDPAEPEAGRATVVVDLASARTGDVQRDETLPQKDWLDVRGRPKPASRRAASWTRGAATTMRSAP